MQKNIAQITVHKRRSINVLFVLGAQKYNQDNWAITLTFFRPNLTFEFFGHDLDFKFVCEFGFIFSGSGRFGPELVGLFPTLLPAQRKIVHICAVSVHYCRYN